MLVGLTIRDLVLIDQLSLPLDNGLCALTGETGAGKSILLDALGLALGSRADSGLVRRGAERAAVTAEFAIPADHPVRTLIREQGLEDGDGGLIVRRVVGADGRSRALLNDQPVSVSLLRQLGGLLVEVHGQFDTQGLLDPRNHRDILDAAGDHGEMLATVAAAWRAWRTAVDTLRALEEEIAKARAEEDYLRHAATELEELDPQPGEEASLAERRAILMNREKLIDALSAALDAVAGDRGADRSIAQAARPLERLQDQAGGRFDPILEALDRAAAELAETTAALQGLMGDMDLEPGGLETIDERLFALRAAARKHSVAVDDLPALRDAMVERLDLIEDRSSRLGELARQADAARHDYLAAAGHLSDARRRTATSLDRAVATELPPLKLDRARFMTAVDAMAEHEWGPSGQDRVAFQVSTNPGAPPGPIGRIASGGELARFLLALKVVLARSGSVPTLVFDEVDSGISGAVAAAVGDRLARLGAQAQVLVVTHSPQVAARAASHWRVRKEDHGDHALTKVDRLVDGDRLEEVARMLSGASITDQARAAAASLMATQPAAGGDLGNGDFGDGVLNLGR